jgi:hypothetical protein
MRYAEGIGMMETVQEKMAPNQEQLTPHDSHLAGFEPEILAFCCEH